MNTLACLIAVVVSLAVRPAGAEPPALRDHLLVSVDQLIDRLDDPDLLLLHVGHGDRGWRVTGHIPGAVFVDIDDVMANDGDDVDALPDREALTAWARSVGITNDPDQRIVVYGEAAGLFAARVYATLATLGLADRAALLDGHFRAWQAHPDATVAQGPKPRADTDFTPVEQAGLLVDTDTLRDRLADPEHGWQLVDARQPRQFRGETLGRPELTQAGHIPTARNAFWQDTFTSIRTPTLRSADELRAAVAGLDPERPVVAYCATGMQSSVTFFVLRYLGYDARWYDGSLIAWQRAGGPTATPASTDDRSSITTPAAATRPASPPVPATRPATPPVE
jgi:thiosulfate/3-mercaptopyruvate sulfurtransferase